MVGFAPGREWGQGRDRAVGRESSDDGGENLAEAAARGYGVLARLGARLSQCSGDLPR